MITFNFLEYICTLILISSIVVTKRMYMYFNSIISDILITFLQVYQEGTVNLSMNCAREAAKHNVRMFVELSTGQVYAADKVLGNTGLCYFSHCIIL